MTRRSFCMVLILAVALTLSRGPLLARAAPPMQPGPWIRFDESIPGRISDEVPEQQWTFQADAGDVVLIEMRAADPGSLDPVLALLGPGGSVLTRDDDGGEGLNARIGPFPLATSGDYVIVASSYNGTGSYTLLVRNLNNIPTLVPGKPLTGALSAEHPADYFRIGAPSSADTPQWFRLQVSASDSLSDPILTLSGPSGVIASTEYDESAAIDPIAFVPGLNYTVAVSFPSSSAGGVYVLSLLPSAIDLLQDGTAVTGTVTPEAFSDRHFFMGAQGEMIRVTLTSPNAPAPAISISSVGSDTEVFVAEGAHTQTVSAVLILPAEGIFVIEINSSAFDMAEIPYTLQIDRGGP